jgi:CheY-like chemotaxis protein
MPRILVVDDEPIIRKTIRMMLSPSEFEIEEAADGQEAVRAYRAHPADLVLCDLFMPEKDGLEVLRELRSEFVGVKVVVMSGGGRGGNLETLRPAGYFGAAGILCKPFKQAELINVVRQVLTPVTV